MLGHPSHIEWSEDQISQASITDSILHMASMPVQSLTEFLPFMNPVHKPQRVSVVVFEGEYPGTLSLNSQATTEWSSGELYEALEHVPSRSEAMWSERGVIEKLQSQWVVDGVIETPSVDVDGSVKITQVQGAWKISTESDELVVSKRWQHELLSEITHLSMLPQGLSVFTISSLHTCKYEDISTECSLGARLVDAAISQCARDGVVVIVSNVVIERRLASSPTMSPTSVGNSTSNLTLTEIVQYQINLWASIALILVLLSAIACLVNMDVQPDSLLYAKFQADVSSKMD